MQRLQKAKMGILGPLQRKARDDASEPRGRARGSLSKLRSFNRDKRKEEKVHINVLAFEIANVITKLSMMWQWLDKKELEVLKTELMAPGVRILTSADIEQVWYWAALEKERELNALAAVVARLGQRCADASLHDVLNPGFVIKVASNKEMDHLITKLEGFVKGKAHHLRPLSSINSRTSNLHVEMMTMDSLIPRLASLQEEEKLVPGSRQEAIENLEQKIVAEKAQLKKLQDNSLWNQDLDKMIFNLARSVGTIRHKMVAIFGPKKSDSVFLMSPTNDLPEGTLGTSGLALHYADVVLTLDKMIRRPWLILRSSRDELYRMLPTHLKAAVRTKLRGVPRPFDMDVAADLKASLEVILDWLVPLANLTLRWQADNRFESRFVGRSKVLLVQTLFYACQDKADQSLLELLAGLSYLLSPATPPMPSILPPPLTGPKVSLATAMLLDQSAKSRRSIPPLDTSSVSSEASLTDRSEDSETDEANEDAASSIEGTPLAGTKEAAALLTKAVSDLGVSPRTSPRERKNSLPRVEKGHSGPLTRFQQQQLNGHQHPHVDDLEENVQDSRILESRELAADCL
eukprot:SM000088S23765  [mRNA]  locus=s88:535872:539688:- [translate_table: standard]